MEKTPLRRCVGCMARKAKSELLMVVRPPKSQEFSQLEVLPGADKSGGRAAYLCKSEDCLKKARKARRFERAFKGKVSLQVYEDLERLIKDD